MKRGATVVFVSSAAIMLVELIAGRLVAPYFGQSTRTWAALTAVTLAGCGIGNAFGGFLAGKHERLKLALILVLSGIYAAILPYLLPFYSPLGLVGFVCAAWLPLAIGLGCVTPLVASLVVRPDSNGRDLGTLYFFSMLGSMLGSLAGGLYLPFVLPADTLYILVAAAMVFAPAVLFVKGGGVCASSSTAGDFNDEPAFDDADGGVPFGLILLGVFSIGAIGMAVEMTAARQVTVVLGGNHIVWSLIFVSFIGWMGVGGYLGGKLADRFRRRWFVTVVLGSTALSIAMTSVIQTRFFGTAVLTWPAWLRYFVQIILGFAPVATLLGMASTVLLKFGTATSLKRGNRQLIGYLYATASAGCVVGTFLTGLILIGMVRSITLMSIFAVAAALLSLPDRMSWLFAAGAFGVAYFARIPLPSEMDASHDQRLVSYKESLYNVVSVTCDIDCESNRTIWLDRIPHTQADVRRQNILSASYTRMIDAVVCAHSNDFANVFMIGGGGYALPACWYNTGHKGRVVVAEIDQAVKDAAFAFMAPGLAKAEKDHESNFEFPVADGRAVVETMEPGCFDFVIGDTISDAAIPYHLVTREFNEKMKRLLREGGVSITHTLDTLDRPVFLSTLVKTLKETYAHIGVMAYTGVTDVRQSLVVVASDSEKALKLNVAAEKLRKVYRNTYLKILTEDEVSALLTYPGAMVLTDRFSPVEKYVWGVITKDLQREGTALGEKALKAAEAKNWEAARRMGIRTLEIEPEQVYALQALGLYAREHPDDLQVHDVLRRQAERPSGLPFAKQLWKWVSTPSK